MRCIAVYTFLVVSDFFLAFQGSLSDFIEDPLSTIPLHLVATNLSISVELSRCQKVKLAVDFADLLFQRSALEADIDFILKVGRLSEAGMSSTLQSYCIKAERKSPSSKHTNT